MVQELQQLLHTSVRLMSTLAIRTAWFDEQLLAALSGPKVRACCLWSETAPMLPADTLAVVPGTAAGRAPWRRQVPAHVAR